MAVCIAVFRTGKKAPPSKNRVGGSPRSSALRAPKIRSQLPESHRVSRPDATITASGRPVWPNRDPIGERGGVNGYAYVNNMTINKYDVLGLLGSFRRCTPGVEPPGTWTLANYIPKDVNDYLVGPIVVSTVSCIFTKTVEIPYSCSCCSGGPITLKNRTVEYASLTDVELGGSEIWRAGTPFPSLPNPASPLLDLIEDVISGKIIPPVPLTPEDGRRVRSLCEKNTPAPRVGGDMILNDSGAPSTWCWWWE